MSDTDHSARLKSLQLNGMAQAWRELQAEAPRAKNLSIEALLRLLEAEEADRLAAACAITSNPRASRCIATTALLEPDVFRLSCSFLLPLREKVARLGRMRGCAKRMMQSAIYEI